MEAIFSTRIKPPEFVATSWHFGLLSSRSAPFNRFPPIFASSVKLVLGIARRRTIPTYTHVPYNGLWHPTGPYKSILWYPLTLIYTTSFKHRSAVVRLCDPSP